jgi:D-alanine transaminase
MSRISYVNGRYLPHAEASLPVEDRSVQFADAVYEVMEYFNHHMLDLAPHLERLERSLNELGIPMPMPRRAMELVIAELLRRNLRRHGLLYLQVSRGEARRDHAARYGLKPGVVMTILPCRTPSVATYRDGIAAITLPDIRWGRCDIKTTSLLGHVLSKYAAMDAGAKDAILLGPDGMVREGSASNLFIITKNGQLLTPPNSQHILPGITRLRIFSIAQRLQISYQERQIDAQALEDAAEIFLTSTSMHLMPITRLNNRPVGEGKIGPLSQRMLNQYHQDVLDETGHACPILTP